MKIYRVISTVLLALIVVLSHAQANDATFMRPYLLNKYGFVSGVERTCISSEYAF